MGFWNKLFGSKKVDSFLSATSNHPLPQLVEEHFHKNFSDGISPTPNKGGSTYEKFKPAWNNGKYDTAFDLLNKAIIFGLEPEDESSAHSYLGQIYLKRGKLLEATNELILSMKMNFRPASIIWESAMRLYYIYSEAGETEIAERLLSFANETNSVLPIPRRHMPIIEADIRELTRRTILSLKDENTEEIIKYTDFIAQLALAIKSVRDGEPGADAKLQKAVSNKTCCSFCKTVVDPINSFRQGEASFHCPNCGELWMKF